MNTYICERCDYSTTRKDHLMNHYNRKSSCKVIKKEITITECKKKLLKKYTKLNCEHCNKKFTSRQGKYQHKKRCPKGGELSSLCGSDVGSDEEKGLDRSNKGVAKDLGIKEGELYKTLELIMFKMLKARECSDREYLNELRDLKNIEAVAQTVNIMITPYKREKSLLSEKEAIMLNYLGESVSVVCEKKKREYELCEYNDEYIRVEEGLIKDSIEHRLMSL